jgi:hypothetical protein
MTVNEYLKKYPLVPYKTVMSKYMSEMERLGVSKVARGEVEGKEGFLQAYAKGEHLNPFWVNKRTAFLNRHLVWFENHLKKRDMAYRHWLSIIGGWGYDPIDIVSKYLPKGRGLSMEDRFKLLAK